MLIHKGTVQILFQVFSGIEETLKEAQFVHQRSILVILPLAMSRNMSFTPHSETPCLIVSSTHY